MIKTVLVGPAFLAFGYHLQAEPDEVQPLLSERFDEEPDSDLAPLAPGNKIQLWDIDDVGGGG